MPLPVSTWSSCRHRLLFRRAPHDRPWMPRVRLGRRCSPALTPCSRPPPGPAPSPVPSRDRRRSRSRPPGEEPPLCVVLFGGDDAVAWFQGRRGRDCCLPHLLCLAATAEACRSGLQFWPHDLLLIPSSLCSGDLHRSAPSSANQSSMEAKTTGVNRAFTSPPPTTTAPPHGRSRQHWRGMEQLSAAVVLDRGRSGRSCLFMQAAAPCRLQVLDNRGMPSSPAFTIMAQDGSDQEGYWAAQRPDKRPGNPEDTREAAVSTIAQTNQGSSSPQKTKAVGGRLVEGDQEGDWVARQLDKRPGSPKDTREAIRVSCFCRPSTQPGVARL